jgi:hypothetical protein
MTFLRCTYDVLTRIYEDADGLKVLVKKESELLVFLPFQSV